MQKHTAVLFSNEHFIHTTIDFYAAGNEPLAIQAKNAWVVFTYANNVKDEIAEAGEAITTTASAERSWTMDGWQVVYIHNNEKGALV